jgi:hypothetical protein
MRIHWIAPAIVFTELACPSLPKPDHCTPRDWICRDDTPYVCSGSQRWTAVSRKCSEFGAECRITNSYYDSGRQIAACVSPVRSDGGAP